MVAQSDNRRVGHYPKRIARRYERGSQRDKLAAVFGFASHVANLWAAATVGLLAKSAGLGAEAFEVAQWAEQSSAAVAVQQTAQRVAAGNDVLATLVRQQQDLSALLRQRNQALLDLLSKPQERTSASQAEITRKGISDTERQLADISARIGKEFPGYAALQAPKPLKVEELQALLRPDEVLVFWLTGIPEATNEISEQDRFNRETYVFALTHDQFDWKAIPISAAALLDEVTQFRRGLDVDKMQASIAARKPKLFDVTFANTLFAQLIGPVDDLVKSKRTSSSFRQAHGRRYRSISLLPRPRLRPQSITRNLLSTATWPG